MGSITETALPSSHSWSEPLIEDGNGETAHPMLNAAGQFQPCPARSSDRKLHCDQSCMSQNNDGPSPGPIIAVCLGAGIFGRGFCTYRDFRLSAARRAG